MAPKRRHAPSPPRTTAASSSSSDQDTSSGDSSSSEEQVAEQLRSAATKISSPPPPAPAHKGSDGSDDTDDELLDIEASEPLQVRNQADDDDGQDTAASWVEAVLQNKVPLLPPELARSPPAKRKLAELAEPSPSKKKAEPSPSKKKALQRQLQAELAKSPGRKGEAAAATEMLAKSLMAPAPPSSSSEEDTSSSDEEVESHPTKINNRPPPAPGDSESESDEAPLIPATKPKGNVPAAKLLEPAPSPKRKAAAAELTESAQPKKSVAAVLKKKAPQHPGSSKTKGKAAPSPADAGGDHGHAGQNAEAKSALYNYLWQEVHALEAEQPGMWKRPFINLADAKARALNTKVKNQRVAQIKLQSGWLDIKKVVTKSLVNILKHN